MPRERSDILPALTEVFRTHGYEGASLTLISRHTGLGKGSLYHFFPGGKEEMAAAVLDGIDAWFENNIFEPLRRDGDPAGAIEAMFAETDRYFRSGERVCIVGVFALGDVRDRFAVRINAYFVAWRDALAAALLRSGRGEAVARDLAEEVVAGIQGALVAARAFGDPDLFRRRLARMRRLVAAS
ncbi:AcrR family transcriptional regulator [Labrys monachus]|uniref:AcrR family transcriptional regulator n=2 Tax=Labrys monachus TaxID=217067 RepID=A0ABU0FFB0_9HYPH|nr:AcrR family transcriptional regulator [Labrys monachus]